MVSMKKVTLAFIAGQIADLAEDVLGMRENMATKNDMANLGRDVDEIKDKLEPLSRAHDKDAETLLAHGRRISRLEKHVDVRT